MIFPQKKSRLKILFVSTEETTFAKVGGLGEVMFSLPRALNELGHDARVMLPRYGTIDPYLHNLKLEYEGLQVPTAPENGGKRLVCNVLRFDPTSETRSPVTTYFLENREYYELRSNAYGYKDDPVRFALLSRGALEFLADGADWLPDVIVATDWMTGFIPNLLATDYAEYKRLKNIATVFSIHNLESQGPLRHHRFIPEMERDDGYGSLPDFFSERMENINAMRRGIRYADVINTVSLKYAEEICTPEFGEGLDGLLRERRERLFGILNGLDYETNDPARDPLLAKNFNSKNLEARKENKAALQKRFGLESDKNRFVAAIASRLTRQKGFELLFKVADTFLKTSLAQLIVVGEGDPEIMTAFKELEKKWPGQVRTHLQFDDELPRLIFAGADAILVPSYFEPSGLIQMEAMRYGAVPVARQTGGLADTVEDFSPEEKRGTAFLFAEYEPSSLLVALVRTWENWRQKEAWKKIQKRAMEKDFSWLASAREYEKLFRLALKLRAKNGAPKTDLE